MEQQPNDRFAGIGKSSRAAHLIAGFIKKNLTMAEEEELDGWILENEVHMHLFNELTDEKVVNDFLQWYDARKVEQRLAETRKILGMPARGRVVAVWKYAAAACIIGLIGVGVVYLFADTKTENKKPIVQQTATDIPPGGQYAQLKLASGQTVLLKPGLDTFINKTIHVKDGQVVSNNEQGNTNWNELIIPRKAHYKLVLPDGTKVFLNAGSSIRYPGSFSGSTREVSVTGESFFEVAKDVNHPFIVRVLRQARDEGLKIQALGTAFNINAYDNEEGITTTLVEGSVKLFDDSRSKTLQPFQQLIMVNDQWTVKKNIDTAPIIAWTNNEFKLKNATIREVMRMVERWYDAKVIYTDKVDFHFNGTISRDLPVSHLLGLLEETGHVHFTIKGNEITVSE